MILLYQKGLILAFNMFKITFVNLNTHQQIPKVILWSKHRFKNIVLKVSVYTKTNHTLISKATPPPHTTQFLDLKKKKKYSSNQI